MKISGESHGKTFDGAERCQTLNRPFFSMIMSAIAAPFYRGFHLSGLEAGVKTSVTPTPEMVRSYR